ncbi:MAG TPA: PD-(D/E)XK nuclease family protein [Anaerolineales bacterium]|nr:PD-(D/E)XK nuclease family protein [Anaerolineales bacterium]
MLPLSWETDHSRFTIEDPVVLIQAAGFFLFYCNCGKFIPATVTTLPPPFTFSQSSLQDYVDCPRRFQLRYMDQLAWPALDSEPVIENERHQIEGQLFHRLAQQYALGLPAEDLLPMANTPNLERWWQHFRQAFKSHPGLHPELTLSAPIGHHRLVAKYDLVAVQDNKAIIYDWKTSAKHPRDEWVSARWQTRVYRALLVQAGSGLNNGRAFGPEQVEMIYWYCDFPSEPTRFRYDANQFKRDWSAIEKVVEEISSAEEFPLTDEERMCRFCVYRSYCNRGVQAGHLDDAEAEMESEANFDVNFEQISEIEF